MSVIDAVSATYVFSTWCFAVLLGTPVWSLKTVTLCQLKLDILVDDAQLLSYVVLMGRDT